MKKLVFLVLVLSVLLVACEPNTNDIKINRSDTYVISGKYGDVERIVDEQAGVVCWVYTSDTTTLGSIDCLLLTDTLLGE